MKLLIITQKVDENDDLLGFFVDWIREFSKKFEKVFVITLAKGVYDLPPNVEIYSLGKESNNSKLIRLVNFYWFLLKLTPRVDGVFAHMSPIFVVASWPVTLIHRKRILFWYLHRSVTFKLKLAEKLCYKIVTAAKESLKFKSRKIVETGHGINIEKFKASEKLKNQKLSLLSVGRISRIKNYDTLLRAIKILKDRNVNFKLKIVGKPVMDADNDYAKELEKMTKELGLNDAVDFVGFVPYSQISSYYNESDMVIGLTPDGGIDKTILEGMASGCLSLTSNQVNRKYFGQYADMLIFNFRDPEDLAAKIIAIKDLPPEVKIEIGVFLSGSVAKNHSLNNVIERISSLF